MSRIVNIVDLPFPPSVNRIWRIGKGKDGGNRIIRSQPYLNWMDAADKLAIANKTPRTTKLINGPFEATITLDRSCGHKGDLDNCAKAVLDWAQSRALVANDKDCQLLIIGWGAQENAPAGCRLMLTQWSARA